jgi:excisionase family DNA binding protein
MEILTVTELAALLKMSKAQVYELTKERTRSGVMRNNPIPFLKINGNVRFRKVDIDGWLGNLVEGKAA